MADLICRHCGNTGLAWDTKQPCGCPAGKAYLHIKQGNEVEAQRIIVDSLVAAQPQAPRAIIRHFAAAMERKLAANDDRKGDWMHANWRDMYRHLRQECSELYEALDAWAEGVYSDEATMLQEIRDEAADVGNMAAILAQRVGALPPTDERGR